MKNTAKTTIARLALAPLVLGLTASAAMAQTYTFKIGAGRIDPRATSGDLEGTLPIGGGATIPVSAGNQLAVQPKNTLLFSIARSFNEHWEAELVLGIPPTHDVKLNVGESVKTGAASAARVFAAAGSTDPTTVITYLATHGAPSVGAARAQYIQLAAAAHLNGYDGTTVARVKQTAPTLFLNYKFLEASSAFRPYLGVGVNYTNFKVTSTQAGNDLYNDGPVRVSSTDSIGLAFQVGANYKFDKNWLVSASWYTAGVKNNVTIRTNSSEQTASYRFHPSVFSVMVGYQF